MRAQGVPSLLDDSDIFLNIAKTRPDDIKLVTTIANSKWTPTYHTLIERNISSEIQSDLKPYTREIKNFNHHESRINNYKIGAVVGSGQFGKVFKCLDESNNAKNKIIALKRINKLKPKYSMNQIMRQVAYWKHFNVDTDGLSVDEISMTMNVNRCRWEIYLMKRTTNDNGGNKHIVKFLQCLDSPNSHDIWIIAEWCDLGELKWKRDYKNEFLNQWEAVVGKDKTVYDFTHKVARDLTKGLKFLQGIGCIHRDIKPSNILVDGRQKILKISDFGCSLLLPEKLPFEYSLDSNIETKQKKVLNACFDKELNKIIGTPAFIAPELCKFTTKLDTIEKQVSTHSSDIKNGFKLDVWSFGVTLYCILFNELPFSGDNEFDTYRKINKQSLSSKRNGDWLNDLIVERMLDKNPNSRIDINSIHKEIKSKVNEPQTINKIGSGAKDSIKKIWKRILNASSNDIIDKKNNIDTEDINMSHVTTNSSLSSDLAPFEGPVNITDFLDSMTTDMLTSEGQDEGDDIQYSKLIDHTNYQSSLSQSPSLGIPTPIKNIIRIRDSPEKLSNTRSIEEPPNYSPLKNKSDRVEQRNSEFSPHPAAAMRPSKNIVDFRSYIQRKQNNESTDTVDQIRDYLNYDGNFD